MISVRSTARRHRLLVATFLVVVALLVVWEHTGEPEPHLDHVGSVCMAVLSGLSAVAVLTAGRWSPPPALPRPTSAIDPVGTLFARPAPLPMARAGPTTLQVLRR